MGAKTKISSRCLVDYVGKVNGSIIYADRTYDGDPQESFINLTALLTQTKFKGKFKQRYKGPSK